MQKYKVKSPLSFNNKDYKIGSFVEMTEEEAEPLLGHTLALPGEELTEKQVAYGVSAIEDEAARLVELGQQLADRERDLQDGFDKLAKDQDELEAGRRQLASDLAEFEKASVKAAKK